MAAGATGHCPGSIRSGYLVGWSGPVTSPVRHRSTVRARVAAWLRSPPRDSTKSRKGSGMSDIAARRTTGRPDVGTVPLTSVT